MDIVFVSNFMNHHQLYLCNRLYEKTGGRFYFVATQPVPNERKQLGYHDLNDQIPYIIKTYEGREKTTQATDLIMNTDVVITGANTDSFVMERIRQNKLTFKYEERIYKNGYIHYVSPNSFLEIYSKNTKFRNNRVYLLCAGAFVSGDYAINGAYHGKAFKWGYFPSVVRYNKECLFDKKNDKPIQLIWVGRLIDWKHPELILDAGKYLHKNGINFSIEVIGTGTMDESIRKAIKRDGLENHIQLLGAMTPEEVRTHMEKANIFLFTSDHNEGWGAVMNEAMNSGCTVLANADIGAAKYLIEDGVNGVLYQNGNTKQFCRKLLYLCQDKEKTRILGNRAYDTIVSEWNPENAADHLLELSEALLKGEGSPFKNGVCSPAKPIFGGKLIAKRVKY